MKKIFICFMFFLSLAVFAGVENVSADGCPPIAPYQCNNGSCVNNPNLCSQSWGGGLSTGSGSSGTTGSTQTGNTTSSGQTCSGDINNNIVDAQNCAKIAEAQAKAKGYTASCNVEVNTNPLGSTVFSPMCTINGSTGHGATLLAGYVSSTGFSINPGWNTLQTEINQFTQTGTLQPCVSGGNTALTCPISTSQNSNTTKIKMTTATPNGTTQTTTGSPALSSFITSINNRIAQLNKDIFSISQEMYKNQLKSFSQVSPAGSAVEYIINNSQATTNTNPEFRVGTISGVGGASYVNTNNTGNPTNTNPNSSCYQFTSTMQTGSTGGEVLKLIEALSKGGFLKTTPLPSVFNFSVDSAIRAFQEANKAEILTPLSLNSGTGIVAERTRNVLNKQCLASNDPLPSTDVVSSIDPNNMSFRYMKVTETKVGWVAFTEIEAYDKADNKIQATAKASDVYGSNSPSNAVDNNLSTIWNAGETNPNCKESYGPECPDSTRVSSIVLDFGSVKNVSRIRLMQAGSTLVGNIVVSVSSDGVSFQPLTSFNAPIGDGEWLDFPYNPSRYSNLPEPKIGATLKINSINLPFSEERNNNFIIYPSLANTLPTASSGQSEYVITANTSSKAGEVGIFLWRVENASYLKIDKSITEDPSLGSISDSYKPTCAITPIYDYSMFPEKYAAKSGEFGMQSEYIFSSEFTTPNSLRYIDVRPSDCNIGKVFTTTLTAFQRQTGKTATYKIIIKVKQ